jgi:hypothetical protein
MPHIRPCRLGANRMRWVRLGTSPIRSLTARCAGSGGSIYIADVQTPVTVQSYALARVTSEPTGNVVESICAQRDGQKDPPQ